MIKERIFINEETEEYGEFSEIKDGLVGWRNERFNNSDLEYISADFLKLFLDASCFNNKYVWNDNECLKENYPEQYLLKQILKITE